MIVDILFVLAIIGILIAIYKTKFSQKKTVQQIKAEIIRETSTQQTKPKQQTQALKTQPSATTQWTGEQQDSGQQNSDDQNNNSPTNARLSLYKQQKRREKQQRKQAQQHFLQETKTKRQEYQKLQEEKQQQEQEKRRKEEEYIEQMREDERKRKEEQFNKWKDMFEVEQTGLSKESQDVLKKKQQQLQNNLLNYLVTRKLTLLQDASHKFSLSTKDLVEKIKKLESQHKIGGVFDDRGKYLQIEEKQWDAVRNYIIAKGRLKKSDMMNECARIIKIPDNHDDELIKLVNSVQHSS